MSMNVSYNDHYCFSATVCDHLDSVAVGDNLNVFASSSSSTAQFAMAGTSQVWMPMQSDLSDGIATFDLSLTSSGSIYHLTFEIKGASSVKILAGTLGLIALQEIIEVS